MADTRQCLCGHEECGHLILQELQNVADFLRENPNDTYDVRWRADNGITTEPSTHFVGRTLTWGKRKLRERQEPALRRRRVDVAEHPEPQRLTPPRAARDGVEYPREPRHRPPRRHPPAAERQIRRVRRVLPKLGWRSVARDVVAAPAPVTPRPAPAPATPQPAPAPGIPQPAPAPGTPRPAPAPAAPRPAPAPAPAAVRESPGPSSVPNPSRYELRGTPERMRRNSSDSSPPASPRRSPRVSHQSGGFQLEDVYEVWQCRSCTYNNRVGCLHCRRCQLPRP